MKEILPLVRCPFSRFADDIATLHGAALPYSAYILFAAAEPTQYGHRVRRQPGAVRCPR
ncbi:MAG: hypothetical protein ACOYEW_05840 [Anaerolineae bacterium]